jgi:four helix bundle protein
MRLPKSNDRDLGVRTRNLAVRIVRLYISLPKTTEAQVLGKQLLLSGTSVGAHIAESNRGKSRADFANKIDGALQELDESVYWMKILMDTRIVDESKLHDLLDECGQLSAILATMVHRVRRNDSINQ